MGVTWRGMELKEPGSETPSVASTTGGRGRARGRGAKKGRQQQRRRRSRPAQPGPDEWGVRRAKERAAERRAAERQKQRRREAGGGGTHAALPAEAAAAGEAGAEEAGTDYAPDFEPSEDGERDEWRGPDEIRHEEESARAIARNTEAPEMLVLPPLGA